MTSLAFFLTALATYGVIVRRTRDWFAPCALLCLFWFVAAAIASVSSLKDPMLQRVWEFETYVVIYLSGVSVFVVGTLLGRRQQRGKVSIAPSTKYRLAVNLLMALSIAAVATRLYVFGFSLDMLIMSFGAIDIKEQLSDAIPFVHYFEIMTPYLCLCAVFELKTSAGISKIRSRWLKSYVIYSIFIYCLLLSASRGALLVIVLGTLFLYVEMERIRIANIILIITSIVAMMSLLSYVRMSSEALSNSFLGDQLLQLIFSPIYTYIAFNFENLNSLIHADAPQTGIFYSLKFLLWPFLKSDYDSGQIGLINFDTLFFNARTYLYAFYHDLGLIGCVLYPSIIALVLVSLHNAVNRDKTKILILMGLQKPIWFTFFGNYFFGELVIFVPLFFVFLLAKIYKNDGDMVLLNRSI